MSSNSVTLKDDWLRRSRRRLISRVLIFLDPDPEPVERRIEAGEMVSLVLLVVVVESLDLVGGGASRLEKGSSSSESSSPS